MSDPLCPKCESLMERGFQADRVDRRTARQSCWHPGRPEPRRVEVLGMNLYEAWVVEVDEEALLPVTIYRCSRCGYLESYALPRG